jgi:two-component sensor histidine kinase
VLFAFVLLLQQTWAEAAQFPFLFFFSAMMISAVLFARGSSYVATALAAAVLAFFMFEPRYAHSPEQVVDWVGLAIFVAVALFSGSLIELLHRTLGDLQRANDALAVSENQKDLLLREAAHRVRNDFMQLVGMIRMEQMAARDNPRMQETLQAISDRVHVFARLQSRLARADEMEVVEIREFIADLCGDLHSSMVGVRPVQVEARADGRHVSEPTAVAVGLIVNELVTNALKHAFPDNRAGRVQVLFRARDHDQCLLCVEDDGVGIDESASREEKHRGLGQKLIRALVQQLQGSYDIRARHEGSGTIATVRFPAT